MEFSVNTALLYPAPTSFNAPTADAFSLFKIIVEPNSVGFSTTPILAKELPVIKSGFSASFSILEYKRTLKAPNSL